MNLLLFNRQPLWKCFFVFRHGKAISFAGLLEAFGVVLCLTTVLSFMGKLGWLIELTTHFRPQYAVLLTALTAIWFSKRRWGLMIACGVATGINLAPICSLCWPTQDLSNPSGQPLRVASVNVTSSNRRFDLVLNWIREVKPDVILLMEIRDARIHEIDRLRETHPHTILELRDDDFGIALLSRFPMTSDTTVELGDSGVPSIEADLQIGRTVIHFIGLHALPPSTAENARLRDAQFHAVATRVRALSVPVVVCGDFNCTQWSPSFAELLRGTRLKDTARGRALAGSWPAPLPFFRIPIDHCLVSETVRVVDRRLGPKVGGDHLPLLIDLAIAQ
ncbi:MAG: hypothetical protein GX456_09895 [Verrucomicrobia bacterium]|nr:hypothetical protein [Verrucomicrobiota bacterium]